MTVFEKFLSLFSFLPFLFFFFFLFFIFFLSFLSLSRGPLTPGPLDIVHPCHPVATPLLSAGIFSGLTKLRELYLSDNLLSTLPDGIFQNLMKLESLHLYQNQITDLRARVFAGLSNLIYLWLSDNLLDTLPNGLFQESSSLKQLFLSRNQITNLSEGMFVGLGKLTHLYLSDNLLSTLPQQIFKDLVNLERLDLQSNQMIRLSLGLFQITLKYLVLSTNQLMNLQVGIFTKLQTLQVLILRENELHVLDEDLFHGLVSLEVLSLSQNNLNHLPTNIFKGLTQLTNLFISENQLTKLDFNIFKGLFNLNFLFLENNTLTELDHDVFKDTVNLNVVDLSVNKLNTIPKMNHLIKLQTLYLTDNTLSNIPNTSFSFLSNDSVVFASQHEVCQCYVPGYVNCSAADNRSPYLTCDRLLSDRALVVIMWLIGLSALIGNLFVLVWRKKGPDTSTVNSMLLQNLAASDLLMGIYMLIIASADIYFGDNFPMQSESWRSGITCKMAGAFSIISSEASVFFVTLISIDRYIAIRFPYSTRRLRKHSVKVVAIVTWSVSFALGIIPSVLSGFDFKFYDNSHVCIGLPLALSRTYVTEKVTSRRTFQIGDLTITQDTDFFTTQYKGLVNGLFFSTAVFLGLNCVCYLIILGCYIEIIRAVRQSIKASGRSQEMQQQIRLTAKVTAIVATDFCC